ncbi:MAG: type II toxin-antitoxin system VapC family toxin [Actinomycetales bacterium]
MTYLLDTHALLWALTEPGRLGAGARTVVLDRASRLLVSAATAWEIATKHRLGKLPQADAVVEGYGRHLDALGVGRLPVLEEHALLAGKLDWAHRDPFDRILAAQAMIESVTLLTMDPDLRALPGVATLW